MSASRMGRMIHFWDSRSLEWRPVFCPPFLISLYMERRKGKMNTNVRSGKLHSAVKCCQSTSCHEARGTMAVTLLVGFLLMAAPLDALEAPENIISLRVGYTEYRQWPQVYSPAMMMAVDKFLQDMAPLSTMYNIRSVISSNSCMKVQNV